MRSPRALWRFLKVKVLRDPLSPEAVAAGWALGMFVGCSVPFGLQLVVSVPLAVVMRVSKVGATLGTFITNPVTIFFIYPAQTYVVNRLLFGGSLSYSRLENMEWTWEAVRQLGAEAVASFFIGGILLAVILTPITYFAVRGLVTCSRRRKRLSAGRTRSRASSPAAQDAARGDCCAEPVVDVDDGHALRAAVEHGQHGCDASRSAAVAD